MLPLPWSTCVTPAVRSGSGDAASTGLGSTSRFEDQAGRWSQLEARWTQELSFFKRDLCRVLMAGSASVGSMAVITGWLLVSHSDGAAADEAVAVRRTASAALPEVSLRVSHSGSTALLMDNSDGLHAATEVVALWYVLRPPPLSNSDVTDLPNLLRLPSSNSDVADLPYPLWLRLPAAAVERALPPPPTTLLRDWTFLGAQRCLVISRVKGKGRRSDPAGISHRPLSGTAERQRLLPPLTTPLSDCTFLGAQHRLASGAGEGRRSDPSEMSQAAAAAAPGATAAARRQLQAVTPDPSDPAGGCGDLHCCCCCC